MRALFDAVRGQLILKIGLPLAMVLFAGIFIWAGFQIRREERFARQIIVKEADRVSNTVKLGLNNAMMQNAREDIQAIVSNCARLPEIHELRIINKSGRVMFSSTADAPATVVPPTDPLCQVCHATEPPLPAVDITRRTSGEALLNGEPILRIVNPIANEPGCSNAGGCHFHRSEEKVLGVLDIAFSLRDSQQLISEFKENTAYLAFFLFAGMFLTLFLLSYALIKLPLGRIKGEARVWARGERPGRDSTNRTDEIGQLSQAIHRMGSDLIDKNTELALQKDLYQDLFEGVPCLVTVQDRNYRLMRFNRSFGEKFNARLGEYCFKAYKNLDAPCPACPVKKTFETGLSQTTEESGFYKDGARAHWIVTTAPVYDSRGELVAAMEMCLDITSRKDLERALKRSERKYHDIFNNVPGAILVLDRDDLSILDCNRGAIIAYGYARGELLGLSFLDLFVDERKEGAIEAIKTGGGIDQSRHITKDGHPFYVNIHTSLSEFAGKQVYLVTVTDITRRLETEQQLIQAGKMATLGEMATGVAHEINQPLSVIQTSIDLVRRHLARGEVPAEGMLKRITDLVAEQVERASKIISHMREFGRKSERHYETIDCHAVLRRAFDFFSQQLTLRGIEVVWELAQSLPAVRCDPNRLEQVCTNLLTNARDAIEDRSASDADAPRRLTLRTMANQDYVTVRISDTGPGVPPALAEKIFEPFFTTKEIGKGTGLGLSISYGIVKECGGEIFVSTNPDGGASFHIRLPVARD